MERETTDGLKDVRKLSDDEVSPELHRDKQKQGYGPRDSIFKAKDGSLWIGGGQGELNPFP